MVLWAIGCTESTTEKPPRADDASITDDATTRATIGIPDELADVESLQMLSDWRALPVFGDGIAARQTSSDRDSHTDLGPMLANGNADLNHFVCPGTDSAIDPSQIVPIVFDIPNCPEHYLRGAVLSRFEGSGRMVRLFLTQASLQSGPPDNEVLRIYVDDERAPRVEVPLAQALDGSASEMFAPPFGAGLYEHLAWYYPVVFATKLIVTLDNLGASDYYYHQTDVILDRIPKERRASTARLPERDVARTRLAGLTSWVDELVPLDLDTTLNIAADSATDVTISGPATIYEIRLAVAETAISSLQSVLLRVEWDDSGENAIDMPLLELFVASQEPPDTSTSVLSGERVAGRQHMRLRIPMPFAEKARWTFTNTSDKAVGFDIATLGDHALPTESWGHLYAVRTHTDGPTTTPYHPLAEVTGRGKFVGTCLMMSGHGASEFEAIYLDDPLNFLEGDDLFQIDGLDLRGTGTEDMFDNCFYFSNGAISTPFSQVWNIVRDASTLQGSVSTCRWFVLTTALDFQSSFSAAIEIGPGRPDLLDDYRSISFVYKARTVTF
jgi:hypothetical protein